MNAAAIEFINDPQRYAWDGFEDASHLAANLVTIFGWDERTSLKIASVLIPALCVCGETFPAGFPFWDSFTHINEAGGYCCPHHGNTCGYHRENSEDMKLWLDKYAEA